MRDDTDAKMIPWTLVSLHSLLLRATPLVHDAVLLQFRRVHGHIDMD